MAMMKNSLVFSALPPEKLIASGGFECSCGKHHAAEIAFLRIAPGAVNSVIQAMSVLNASYPMLICGPNGYEAAGRQVDALLKDAGIRYKLHIIPCAQGKQVKPDEFAVGSAALAFEKNCDLIIGVGSGVINDICKVVAAITGRPFMIVGTAPSMDGYASDGASMEVNNVKLSLTEKSPSAIICDTNIMAQAPMRMLWAGLGDMLAKYTALCEWRIASIVTGEYYCEEVARLMRSSLQKIRFAALDVRHRSVEAVGTVMEGLVLSGIAMAFAGVSRPASGLEHYFSHAWEMMALSRGKEPDLHGIQVGVGTLLTLKIFERLKSIRPDKNRLELAISRFDASAWEQNVRRVFGGTADSIIAMEKTAGKNDAGMRRVRAGRIIDRWADIISVINEELPPYEEIESLIKTVGMPMRPQEIGFSAQDTVDAYVCSRDIRSKYLTSSMIWDIGYMDEFAHWLMRECV